MVAGMTSDQLTQWNTRFLNDIGATNYAVQARDLGFLGAWENREGVGSLATFNPLATTMQGYGGHPINSVGVAAYPDIASGAAANAAALMGNNPGYAELLNAFQTGTLDQSKDYLGLSTWSGPGGYSNLSGISSQVGGGGSNNPPPGTTNNPVDATSRGIQNDALAREIKLQNDLAVIDEQYAKQEADFQNRLLALQRESLGISEGGLARQLAEAPALQADVNRMFALQFAGVQAQGGELRRKYDLNKAQMFSGQAGAGSLFSKGARDERLDLVKTWQYQAGELDRRRRELLARQNQEAIGYLEKISAMLDQKKQYDIVSQRYGIQGEEIAARLASTLKQTGIGAGMNVTDLFSQMLQNTAGFVTDVGSPAITSLSSAGDTGGVFQNPTTPIAGIGGGGYGS